MSTSDTPIQHYSAENSPRGFWYHAPRAVTGLIGALRANPVLSRHMFRSQVASKFRGTALGPFWVMIHPVFLFAVYFVIFSVLFNRGGADQTPGMFAIYLFSGIVMFHGLMQGTNQAMGSITGNSNLVKKLAFPSELLPLMPVVGELAVALFGVSLALLAGAFITDALQFISWPVLLLPVTMLAASLLGIGIGFTLATVSVFYADIRQLYTIFSTAWFFLSPNFWLPSLIEEQGELMLFFAQLNPTFPLLIAHRQCLGILPAEAIPEQSLYFSVFESLGLALLWGVLFLVLGYGLLMQQKRKFADLV